MAEIKVDVSELKSEGKDAQKLLADFLKEKTSADVSSEAKMVTVKGEGDAVNKKYVKVLLKKFLHHNELKDTFRVIGGEENTLKIKERKIYQED
ncbi:MAG: hypothetical protein GX638_11070 [Crenarchaeota archaeon]|nr:hypothetical protein [Thermoproteota archaeon]